MDVLIDDRPSVRFAAGLSLGTCELNAIPHRCIDSGSPVKENSVWYRLRGYTSEVAECAALADRGPGIDVSQFRHDLQ